MGFPFHKKPHRPLPQKTKTQPPSTPPPQKKNKKPAFLSLRKKGFQEKRRTKTPHKKTANKQTSWKPLPFSTRNRVFFFSTTQLAKIPRQQYSKTKKASS
jgi:hypothetical protein